MTFCPERLSAEPGRSAPRAEASLPKRPFALVPPCQHAGRAALEPERTGVSAAHEPGAPFGEETSGSSPAAYDRGGGHTRRPAGSCRRRTSRNGNSEMPSVGLAGESMGPPMRPEADVRHAPKPDFSPASLLPRRGPWRAQDAGFRLGDEAPSPGPTRTTGGSRARGDAGRGPGRIAQKREERRAAPLRRKRSRRGRKLRAGLARARKVARGADRSPGGVRISAVAETAAQVTGSPTGSC